MRSIGRRGGDSKDQRRERRVSSSSGLLGHVSTTQRLSDRKRRPKKYKIRCMHPNTNERSLSLVLYSRTSYLSPFFSLFLSLCIISVVPFLMLRKIHNRSVLCILSRCLPIYHTINRGGERRGDGEGGDGKKRGGKRGEDKGFMLNAKVRQNLLRTQNTS